MEARLVDFNDELHLYQDGRWAGSRMHPNVGAWFALNLLLPSIEGRWAIVGTYEVDEGFEGVLPESFSEIPPEMLHELDENWKRMPAETVTRPAKHPDSGSSRQVDASQIDLLVKELSSRDKKRQQVAADSLGCVGTDAAEALARALVSRSRDCRAWSSWLLLQMATDGNQFAAPAIVAAISARLEDPDWETRRYVAAALGYIGSVPALAALKTASGSEVEVTRAFAACGLYAAADEGAREQVVELLRTGTADGRWAAARGLELVSSSSDDITELQAALTDRSKYVREGAQMSIRAIEARIAAQVEGSAGADNVADVVMRDSSPEAPTPDAAEDAQDRTDGLRFEDADASEAFAALRHWVLNESPPRSEPSRVEDLRDAFGHVAGALLSLGSDEWDALGVLAREAWSDEDRDEGSAEFGELRERLVPELVESSPRFARRVVWDYMSGKRFTEWADEAAEAIGIEPASITALCDAHCFPGDAAFVSAMEAIGAREIIDAASKEKLRDSLRQLSHQRIVYPNHKMPMLRRGPRLPYQPTPDVSLEPQATALCDWLLEHERELDDDEPVRHVFSALEALKEDDVLSGLAVRVWSDVSRDGMSGQMLRMFLARHLVELEPEAAREVVIDILTTRRDDFEWAVAAHALGLDEDELADAEESELSSLVRAGVASASGEQLAEALTGSAEPPVRTLMGIRLIRRPNPAFGECSPLIDIDE